MRLHASVQPEVKSRSFGSATPRSAAQSRRASKTTREAAMAIPYVPRPGFAPAVSISERIASRTSRGLGHDVAALSR
jgi:tRNA A37 threonylcarbamoyltransferase TsaD